MFVLYCFNCLFRVLTESTLKQFLFLSLQKSEPTAKPNLSIKDNVCGVDMDKGGSLEKAIGKSKLSPGLGRWVSS